jgi:hypothetical protein
MDARRAWVLNLDADLELGADDRYQPTRNVRLAVAAHARVLAASLLAPGDLLVNEESPAGAASGLPGRAFCPTPRAIRALLRAGAVPEPHPGVAVLRRVNSRAFASALGATMPGAAFVTDGTEAWARLVEDPPVGDAWRVKHAFGMAGRNQRRIEAARLRAADEAFVRSGLANGGVQIEPNVAIEEEYAQHGVVAADGSVRLGVLVRQRCDSRGAWIASEPLLAPVPFEPAPERDAARDRVAQELPSEAHRVAAALHREGYMGPFGIDAYTYRDRAGALCLQPRSEINARYTMGFAAGWSSAPANEPVNAR